MKIMSAMFARVKYLPLLLGMVYLGITVMLFFAGPFNWPIKNEGLMLFFLSTCLLGIVLGFSIGVIKRGQGQPLDAWRLFFRIGSIFSIALVSPATWVYTGKWPWEILSVLGDQGLAYREMLAALDADESGIRGYLAIVRAVFAPFVYCVVPFAILKWKELRRFDVLLLAAHICSILVFSFMRGTDRETGELVIFLLATLLIAICRLAVDRGRFPFKLSTFFISSVVLFCVLSAAIFLFVDRKESRMGGSENFCVAGGVVCSVREPNQDPLDAKVSFGAEIFTGYLAQGYYGLSLALNEDFSPTFGLGHSAFLMSAYTKLFDQTIYQRSYLYKVGKAGWDDKAQWSTIFSWLASDVSFPVVPVVMAILGFLWGCAWKSAVLCKSDTGALVFLFLSLSVLYIPANNQLTQTLDSYFAFLFWLLLWLSQGRNKANAAQGVLQR